MVLLFCAPHVPSFVTAPRGVEEGLAAVEELVLEELILEEELVLEELEELHGPL